MNLLAAIDLRGGQAVRLLKGDYGQETGYGDPLELARSFEAQGTDWLHLVDLDAARDGGSANRSVVLEIATNTSVPVEMGGGVRTFDDVVQLLDGGVSRVIMGTAALEDPSLLARAASAYPGRIGVGLDYRLNQEGHAEVAVRGWLEGAGLSLNEAVDRVCEADIAALIVTAIDRDGTLEGPDLAGLGTMLELTDVPVVASAGVSALGDLTAIRSLKGPRGQRIEGAVVGKALVEGRFSVAEAVAACR